MVFFPLGNRGGKIKLYSWLSILNWFWETGILIPSNQVCMRRHNCTCHIWLSYLTQLSCHVQLRANVIWKDSHNLCCMNIYAAHETIISHTVHRTEIPAVLDSWVKNTPFVKTCPLKIAASLYFHKEKPAYVLICREFAKFIPSPVKLCVSGSRQLALSWTTCPLTFKSLTTYIYVIPQR